MTGHPNGRIVVGVDGSTHAKAALAWALDEARLRGASVEIVHVWQFPSVAMTSFGSASLPVVTPEDLGAAAEAVIHDVVAGLTPEDRKLVTSTVERGHPAEVLLAAAKGADMLVVGSRGHGGFAGMLLGSVSSQVVHHAPCPVVVVRGEAVAD